MIENILKDRLKSIDLYEAKLKKDRKKVAKLKKSEDVLVVKKAVELENSISEVLVFIETYKKELQSFLGNSVFTMVAYQEKMARYDEKFFEVLKFIQKKEEDFRTVEV